MIRSLETPSEIIPVRKVATPHKILIMLLISIATILVSAIPGSASASSGMEPTGNFGYAHLLLFTTSSLKSPLR